MADEGLKGGGCCGSKPAQATTITIHKAVGVEKQDVVGGKILRYPTFHFNQGSIRKGK